LDDQCIDLFFGDFGITFIFNNIHLLHCRIIIALHAFSFIALAGYFTAHEFGQLFANYQSETTAAELSGNG
jgi:hypothetical protein